MTFNNEESPTRSTAYHSGEESDGYMSYSDEESGSGCEGDYCEEMEAMTIVPPAPSPYKLMLMKNLESCQMAQDGQKKRNQAQQGKFHQTVFCSRPVLQVNHIHQCKSARAAAENARIGDVDIFGDEDDGVGTLTDSAIDDKASQVLVRARGNRLTAKQAEVKAARVKAKAN